MYKPLFLTHLLIEDKIFYNIVVFHIKVNMIWFYSPQAQ